MIAGLIQIIVALMIVVGAGFSLIAAIGMLRFPDVYSRMHAASKAGTLGAGLLLLAMAIFAAELGIATRAIAGIVFLLLTAPISAHLLARAAYFVGYPTWDGTKIDDLKGKYRIDGDHISCAGTEVTES